MKVRQVGMVALVLVGLLAPATASASERTIEDPVGDTWMEFAWDIASASHGHSPKTERFPRFLSHTVMSVEPVSDDQVAQGETEFRFNFDTKDDGEFERSIVVQYVDGKYRADMWRTGYPWHPEFRDSNEWVAFVRVLRRNDNSLTVQFPRRYLGKKGRDSYRWMGEVYRGPTYKSWCADGDMPPCYDRTRAVRHRL